MLEWVADVGSIDGLQVVTFLVRDVVARGDEVRSDPRSFLYWRADRVMNKLAFWAYQIEEVALSTGSPSRYRQGGQCALIRFRNLHSAGNLWGRPVQFRCAVGTGSASI